MLPSHLGHQGTELLLLARGELEVVNRTTLQTNEVVVMAGQPLRQFVTIKSIAVMHGENAGLTHDR
jgi:hypothetical protein